MDQSKIDVMDKLLTVSILFISVLLLLEVSDRSLNTLIALSSVGGLAIAFASQEVISNFFGGLMIYATHPFAKGDWIQIPDRQIEGFVEEIGWYMTRVRSMDKRPIYVPNSIFSKIVVITPSRMTHRQFKETVGLRYSDMPALRAIKEDIKEMLQHHPAVDRNLTVSVNFHAFGSYSLDILVQANITVLDSDSYAKIRDEFLFKIADIVSKHDAEMASPMSTLYIPEKNGARLIKEISQ
jgi:MscS family membrane protein